MDASCKIQRSIHDVRLTYKYVSRILGTYHFYIQNTAVLLFLYYMEIHPNAFATELSRMIAAKIGQRYLIIKLKIFFLLKVPSPRTTSSSIFFSPITLEIRRHVAIAAIGIITELVRKSKKSRNCIPMIFTHASGP